MKGIDGKEVDLAAFQGKVVMFVNVASECGLTGTIQGPPSDLREMTKKDL
jgi:glutathione peroxidase